MAATNSTLRVLVIDTSTGFYRVQRYKLGDFFGPVDLGLHLAGKHNSLNFGTGLLAGSIFPGSNRLVFTGFSPAWGGFYVSSMGGAGLVFDNLGINLVAITGKAAHPSVLYLNREHGEEIEVELHPIHADSIWQEGEGGVYSMMQNTLERFGSRYIQQPRVLATGPAVRYSDFGGIVSAPITDGKISHIDTWAGRGGMGSKLFQQHGIAAVIYGGTHVDDDFKDRRVADSWFQARYELKLLAKDFEATRKYRFDPAFDTGGTFGVNYSGNAGTLLAFNYRSMYWTEQQRQDFHARHIRDHYLKQFNAETIVPKKYATCGEPCVAVCKKFNGKYKKDFEPYQALGPLIGVFDQRAAEAICHKADTLGFDAISAGGMLAWMMECLSDGILPPETFGVGTLPRWDADNFDTVADSQHNSAMAIRLLENCVFDTRCITLNEGARKLARGLARKHGKQVMDSFVFNSFARRGWMVPNQYWTPGVLSPMPAMGRYYMFYGQDYFPPRVLGKVNADRMKTELMLDNLGICRFHRAWAEEMLPEIVESIWGKGREMLLNTHITARRINCRNASVFWESIRSIDFIHTFLRRQSETPGNADPDLLAWLERFDKDKHAAAFDYWYEIRKGIDESLRERPDAD
jgi:glyceraldehyde-3-phosphate dehydrogenase (ferredoxin)